MDDRPRVTERTPRHHHYTGLSCASMGRVCTSPRCWWAVDSGIVPLHADCEPMTLECAVALPEHDGDVAMSTVIVEQTGYATEVPMCELHRSIVAVAR